MKRRSKKKSVKTKTKKKITEIVSDTDTDIGTNEVVCRTLALYGEVNASGGDSLDKNTKNSAVTKPIVEMEIIEIESDTDEVDGRMLALCGPENALGDGTLAENPKKTIVKKDITEIRSDTDEVGGRMLANCGVENALGDGTLSENTEKTIVKKDITEIRSDTDEVGGRMLAICGLENALGDGTLVENLANTSVAKTIVKNDIIEIESDTDESTGRMLGFYGSENERVHHGSLGKDEEHNRISKQIVCADDCNSGLAHDLTYKQYLATFNEIGNEYLLEDYVRDSYPKRLMYNVDHKASYTSKGRAVKSKKSRVVRKEKSPMISSRASKRLKTENCKADHHSVSRTVFRTKETQKKSYVAKNTVIQRKKEDVQHVRTISVAKKNVKMKPTSNATSQTIIRASKRLKTEIGRADHNSTSKSISVVNRKETKRMKQKHHIESNSISYVKDSLLYSFKSVDKENEDTVSSLDKSYAYFLSGLKKSIILYKSDPDIMGLSDPDILAISDHPFPDEDITPFEATKDGKVHDLEDDIEPDDVFNSLFSKKLIEVLKKPYDKEEFLRLYHEASLQRPLTRIRQLRDGRDFQYDVDDELRPSYLEIYSDLNKKYLHCRKDRPRALNLLRGFFFYLKNIVHEGAFKPWLYEKCLRNVCFDASGCKYITYNK